MYFVEKTFKDNLLNQSDLPQTFNKENSAFFDIETTGLSPKTSFVFLIGLVFFKNNLIIIRQYFANTPDEEESILKNFIEDISHIDTLYHFNGYSFDIPFINCRLLYHNNNFQIKKESSIDIYQNVRKNKFALNIENTSLRGVEEYFNIFRVDSMHGKEVADTYKVYLKSPNQNLRDGLLLHNEEDILNLYKVLPVLKLIQDKKIYNNPSIVEILSIDIIDNVINIKGKLKSEKKFSIPKPNDKFCFSSDNNNNFCISFNFQNSILYYKFKDFKQYYFVPEQDMAIHKSLIKFYEFSKKVPANSKNCYSKQLTNYIELPKAVFSENIKICSTSPCGITNCIPIAEIQKNINSNHLFELFQIVIDKIISSSFI